MIECSSENVWYKKRPKKKFRRFFAVVFALLLFIFIIFYYKYHVSNYVFEICSDYSYSQATSAVNTAVIDTFSEKTEYNDIITVSTNNLGEIEMLKANTSKINVMTRKITNITTKKLTENLNAGIPVQSLAFTGIELLSGYGKIVLIKTVSVTDATCDLSSEFKSAGINQTIHSIYAIVRVNVNIELPMKKKTQTYETKVLVSEAVLVGKVPEVYLNGGLMS